MRPVLADPEDDRRVTEAQVHREAYGEFLSHFKWDLYATPSFKWPVTYSQARAAVHDWVSFFGPQAYAVVAYERGLAGGRTHVHVLLGGLVGEIAKSKAGRLWRRGHVKIERYDPRRGACWYIPKTFYNHPEAGEFIGDPKTISRRKRGRKKVRERDVTREATAT